MAHHHLAPSKLARLMPIDVHDDEDSASREERSAGFGTGFRWWRSVHERAGSTEQGIATVEAALDAGINFLVTADFYGMGDSETLIGRAIKGRRDCVFLSVKFGILLRRRARSSGWMGGRKQSRTSRPIHSSVWV
jgi:aryl-alcohol dehydrogenase-like predicted oxidoreductase